MANNMKKSDYTGWKDVFRFSFIQGVKSKSFYVMLIILSLVLFVSVPLMAWLQQRNSGELSDSKVEKLLIFDDTGINIDFANCLKDERYKGLKVETVSGNFDDQVKKLEENKKSCEVAVHIVFDQVSLFRITFAKASESGIKSNDFNGMAEDFCNFFDEAKLKAIDVTEEQSKYLEKQIATTVEYTGINESGEIEITPPEHEEGISLQNYMAFLALIIVVMMIINLSGASIANSIVTEKTTRVVEYLMINVRPMALIVGKILSSLLQVAIQLVCFAVSYIAGNALSKQLFGAIQAEDDSSNMYLALIKMFGDITVDKLICICLVIIGGVALFCIFAGLAGASVSKLEELSEGMKTYQLLLIGGSYVGMGVCIAELSGKVNGTLLDVLSIFPITSPFVLPSNLVLGKVGIPVAIISIVVLFISVAVLFKFTSMVYESLIFYNGNVLKFKDIIQIAKNRKASAKVEAKEEK